MSKFATTFDDLNQGSGNGPSIKFGLNENAVLVGVIRFPYPNGDGTPGSTIQAFFNFLDKEGNIILNKNGKPFTQNQLISLVRKGASVKTNKTYNEIETDDIDHPFYKRLLTNEIASASSLFEIVFGKEKAQKILLDCERGASDYYDYFDNMIEFIESPQFQSQLGKGVKCHLFLEYPYTPESRDIDKNGNKYLTIPKNAKQGRWSCPYIEGSFEKVITDSGSLHYYKNGDVNSEPHPFTRSSWYLDNDFAKKEVIANKKAGGQDFSEDNLPFGDTSSSATKASGWGSFNQ